MEKPKKQGRRDPAPDPMAGRKPGIRIDDVTIREMPEYRGCYQVRISGHNLRMAISPPRIEVGGVPLEDLTFDKDGRAVSGTLACKPESERVVVDYGFAREQSEVHWDDGN
jgi:hypothetical protein